VFYTSHAESVRGHIKITRNEYKITNWIPFFSKPETNTFYSIDDYKSNSRLNENLNVA